MTDDKPRPRKIKTSVELCEENYEQLRSLARTYHLSHNATVGQAIAKWFHADPVIKQRRSVNKEKQRHGPDQP